MLIFLLFAAAPTLHVEHLEVEGEVQDVASADFDGDGANDILVASIAHKKNDAKRLFTIFWNDNGAFTSASHTALSVPSDLAAFDVGDLGDGAQVFSLAHDGVSAVSLHGRAASEWHRVISAPTLFLRATRKELVRWRTVQSLGGPRLVVPGISTLTIYEKTGATFTKRSAVSFTLETSFEDDFRSRDPKRSTQPNVSFQLHLPSLYLLDMNADGRADLVLLQGERITVFSQSATGELAPTPVLEHHFPVRGANEEAEVELLVVDVDGDGRGDVVATKMTNTGITSATTTVSYFHATELGFSETPEQTIVSDGASLGAIQVADVDGDGHIDLLVPSVRFGLMAIVRMLTSSSIKVGFSLYPFDGQHFAAKPSVSRDLSFSLNLGHNNQLQIADMYGDYNGDGKVDLVWGSSSGELSFALGGQPGKLFADDTFAKLAMPTQGKAHPLTLNKGRSSLVVFYPEEAEKKNEIVVISAQ